MTRSIWKGPTINYKILYGLTKQLKIWSRESVIPAKLIDKSVFVHNGKIFKRIAITRDKIGYKFGEFCLTRTYNNKYKNFKKKKK